MRLRDLGGLIVIDFIDMEDPAHQRAIEQRIKDAGQLVDTGTVLAGFLWRRLWRFSANEI